MNQIQRKIYPCQESFRREGVTLPKILIYANDKVTSQNTAIKIRTELQQQGIEEVEEGQAPDYILTVGGDGTLLSAFHKYREYIDRAQFIGIHTGHLGFYTDWLPEEVDDIVKGLLSKNASTIEYPLVEMLVKEKNQDQAYHLALNECAIRSMNGTMVCRVSIHGDIFEIFRGDGICVSTPTGSTGLNKSLGGAVMDPRISAIQMTEMASLNNRVYRTLSSPIIVPEGEMIEVVPIAPGQHFMLSMDNKTLQSNSIEWVQFKVSKRKVKFAGFNHRKFWQRVSESFIGLEAKD